ncbi:preprotein translocase subunit YajC [Flavilitoribacter nigricans]|uniref:Sec translocon accessory complex subunit YajC n=1 Tax=Flavilitoribacter nigricans (strain ATCC 23147 / DSM 23189 / NBRC 102662 / NCIMB 1420 / SS-2) TaxID=1122177 RepID=A0A2D0NIN1_FLAN2|nr:preprotein translocase subunit YajC [Flavilitoribacter nigricans]PHN08351.1 preprotein translocase subunit YajC [Flavilitoribacter nigricans DSM 23189 = NBRC 102662]
MNMEILFLQAGGAGSMNLLFLGAMILIFWLFLIRPQAKKQREQKTFMESLGQNDQVVTASGILGRISKIEDDIVTLEVASKSYIRVTKNAISKEMTDAIYGEDKKTT